MKKIVVLMIVVCLFSAQYLLADEGILVAPSLSELQRQWAIANYQLAGEEQNKAFSTLIADAEVATKVDADSAEVWIWDGIIKSSYAGVKGGLGALALVKSSRKSLERAVELNGNALQGSAYTSLGVLYYRTPGWPIAFGDHKKAKELLQQAIKIDPDGIDTNYFYGDYLIGEKEYQEAKKYLLKAKSAAPRVGREVADQGRQQEIEQALAVVEKKLK